MRAGSQKSYEAASERWEVLELGRSVDLKAMALDILSVADLLDANAQLRRALTDPAASPAAKAALVTSVFGDSVAGEVVDLVAGMARATWSDEGDLSAALGLIAVNTVMDDAKADGKLDLVENELFSLEQLLGTEKDLRNALEDRLAEPEARVALSRKVFGGKLDPRTELLFERVVAKDVLTSGIRNALRDQIRLAAERQQFMVAIVTAAAPLSDEHIDRIERLLADRYGRPVHVHIHIDPAIIGGLRIEIGDDVVDGTMSSRIAAARRHLTD